ncbi:hypothetical protein MTO96_011731 [Rhipicephalus appendiculatus]
MMVKRERFIGQPRGCSRIASDGSPPHGANAVSCPVSLAAKRPRRQPSTAVEKPAAASPLVQRRPCRWPPFLCALPLFVLAAALLKNTPTPLTDPDATKPNKRSTLRRQRDRREGLVEW